MALTTLDWDDIGYPQDLEIIEICHTIRHPYGGGYNATRPAAKKMQKKFFPIWTAMTSAQWLNFITFWRSVYGSANAFYFEYPNSLYGVPGYGGDNIGDPPDGFDTDVLVGYGDPAMFTCKFEHDELPQKYKTRFKGRWEVSVSILELV